MKMSCNGCRVLRKACNDKCNIRPCLEWITNPEAQANVTVFLSKFYGRAGLTNLLNAGPDRNRPAIFKSMLYEACGRIVNPIYGSVGLLWSGSWQLNQAAVEAVLRGEPIRQMPLEAATAPSRMPAAYDIRHFSRVLAPAPSNRMAVELHRVVQTRTGQFKRSGAGKKATGAAAAAALELAESSGSHVTEDVAEVTSVAVQGEPAGAAAAAVDSNELGLELTLGGVYGYRAAN